MKILCRILTLLTLSMAVTPAALAEIDALEPELLDPDEAFAISLREVPQAGGENEAANRAIFEEVLKLWQTAPGEQLGASDPQVWSRAADFMEEMGLIDKKVNSADLFTNDFVTGAGD